MADAPRANAVVAQSGGPTAVINASLVGVIEEANKHPEIENLYGSLHAVVARSSRNGQRPVYRFETSFG
jgi:6-phosphofructokinase 1